MSDEVKPDLVTQTDSTNDTEHHTEHDTEQHEVELGLNDHNNFDDDLKEEDDFSTTNNVNHSNNLVIKSEDTKQEDSNDELLVGSVVDDAGLYDDVMAEPTSSFSNETSQHQLLDESTNKQHKTYTKRVSCYVGNLTWWTTDKDLSDICQTLGVNDLVEIKFYENKINGQSKGFAMVTVGSDQSFRALMDKLPKKQLNGQEPVVTHYSRHYFNQFEEQARKDMPATAANNEQQVFHHHQPQQQHQQHHHHNGSLNGSLNNANINQHSQPILQNRIRNNSFPAQSTSSTSLNNGIIGGSQQHQHNTMSLNNNNRSLNNNINNNNSNRPLQHQQQQQHQTSLVGNYQANNNQIRMPSQQMGIMPNPALNNRQFNNNNNNQQMYNNNRPMLNQQTSLLGNRPPLLQTQHMLRPQLPLQQQPQMGLLNNPRMPINNMLPRQDWDNNNNNNRNYNNNSQTNGILPTNPMLMMNQQQQRNNLNNIPQQQSMPITPNTPNTGSSQFGYNNPSLLPNSSILPVANQFQQLPQFSNMHNQQHLSNYNQMINQNQLAMNQPHHMNHTNMPANQALIQQQQQHQHQQQSHHDLNHHPHHMADSYSYQRTNSGTNLIENQIMPNHHLQQQQSTHLKLNELEFQEALEKNRIVSGSALARAVQDASNGQYPSAIETLQTAISLIKQSKISQDERCKLLISSLQDTKKGIEDRYYTNSNSMIVPNGTNQPGLILNSNRANSSGSRGDSRDRERLKRSRSRDSRSRDRDRDRDRSKRGGASEKHHRSSHRDRSRERRVNSGGSSLVSNGGGAPSGGNDYYDEHSSSSRYHHRSRH